MSGGKHAAAERSETGRNGSDQDALANADIGERREVARPATAAPPATAEALPEPYVRPDLYDLLFGNYRVDLGFWLELARAARGPVLDLCCGTGRVLLAALEAGVDAEGADLYPEMLERLRTNASARGLEARAHRADMRSFALPRRYAAVLIPFNAFAHNLTADDQLATLECCREHLAPGGLLALDVFSATPEMVAHPVADPVMELEVHDPASGRTFQLYDGRALDPARQIQRSAIEIRELDGDRTPVASHRFETEVRWVYPSEMELLLRLSGFARWEIFGGFDRRPCSAASGSIVVTAWRA